MMTSANGAQVVATTAETVRRTIAWCVLERCAANASTISEQLGSIRLRPHQIDAVSRLRRLIDESGGAMLADEVGLGKTYVALALARDVGRTVVVAPAALHSMWHDALARARLDATVLSFERLSRARGERDWITTIDPQLVVVDEAHHARTPTTRRYGALAALCARSRVLLLSATPLQNSARDLAAQLALFLGTAAWALTDDERARYVVRRTRRDVPVEALATPAIDPPVWIEAANDDDCLDALLALPTPIPAADGGDGGALLVYTLVRRWASSRAALRATLRRRLTRAAAMTAMLESGRYPSRTEMAAWTYADATVQLAFPELVGAPIDRAGTGERRDLGALLAAVRHHESAVRDLLRALERPPDPDVARAAAIRALRERHRGERIIAFAEAAETVEAMFRQLRTDAGVGMIGPRGGAVSGGTISRREALSRFAPVAQGVAPPDRSRRIDLLLTTDLLSEGVNLQDASVVVHLDLPWNPARLEQRVGRVSRLGSAHDRVSVYAIKPPAAAERLLAVEQRLRAKLTTATRSLGIVGTILPGLDTLPRADRGAAEEWTRIHALLGNWAMRGSAPWRGDGLCVAAVRSPVGGYVAAFDGVDQPLLLCSLRGRAPSAAPHDVVATLELAAGNDESVDADALAHAMSAIDDCLARHAANELSGADVAAIACTRRRVLTRINLIGARTARHAWSATSRLIADARRATLMPLAAGAERVLAELADVRMADEAWLRAIVAFGDLNGRPPAGYGTRHAASTPRPVALLLLIA